jgi:PrcB C-terminal
MLIALVVLQVLASFTTVARGTNSSIDESRQVVIRGADEWQALWKAHDPDRAMPAVDFTRSQVVGFFLGSRPTAGFSVEITAVKKDGERAVVEYVERRPPPGALTAQVLTSPYHLVSVSRDIGMVEFRRLQP